MDNNTTNSLSPSKQMRAGDYIAFRPALTGPFATRFYETARELALNQPSLAEFNNRLEKELIWATDVQKINVPQRRIYRAVWMLFRDLVRVGWRYRWLAGTLEVGPPTDENGSTAVEHVTQIKEAIRQAMLGPRLEKIIEGQEFIRRMETINQNGISILNLLADGPSLVHDLQQAAQLTDELKQLAALRDKIQPYLQLVSDERCALTGYHLSDIWRYFRLTWATPAENTPGRTMLYLVRDAARPYHPIMGIASLENAPLLISVRDDYLGWSMKSFVERVQATLDETSVRAEFDRLLVYIATAIDELDASDLCSNEECQNPKPATYQKLKNIAARSVTERDQALQKWQMRLTNQDEDVYDDDLAEDRSEFGNISKDAEDALYRRKRAERLGKLLFARDKIRYLLEMKNFAIRWREFVASKSGQSIIRVALQSQKSRHVGTSIMELNVCGAIPPYNDILGGKLVALLMLSPQVIGDYKARYGNRPSDIATRMKGTPVIRPADIVFLGTTSLYRIGASQYNRLNLPDKFFKPNAPQVKWQKLGETSGFGTLHISRLTLKALEEASSKDGVSHVNHIFGEGASPKLRAIRQALGAVLVSGSKETKGEFTRHSMSRLVYGVWLATNGHDFLTGQADKPNYYFDLSINPIEATEKIADYWRSRWLHMRIIQSAVLDRVKNFDPARLLVSNYLQDTMLTHFKNIKEEPALLPETSADMSMTLLNLAQKLYRGLSSYADNMTQEWLAAIHVKTALDDEIIQAVASGKSVVLTGNPGDGKTHLLRIIAPQLAKLSTQPLIELDASAITNDELQAKWALAVTQGRPFCAAVNEAVLKDLADTYPDFVPVQAAQRQVEQAVTYVNESSPDSGLVVFDLSLRNILDTQIVTQVIDRLTKLNCDSCPNKGCDATQNKELLQDDRVRQRLQALLDRVSRRGYHATLRELQALISFLLFGGRTCDQLLRESGNEDKFLPQLIYTGKGALFQQIQNTFDPVNVSHPVWDDRLICAETDSSHWLSEWHGQANALTPDNWEGFKARKRAFYFFHKNGGDLLTLDSNDETEFADFLLKSPSKALRLLITRINTFFGDDIRNKIRVWQSHRFSQAPRRVLYSISVINASEFELVHPSLCAEMARAYTVNKDHLLLRLRNFHQARLRVDFSIFELLAQAERGVPALTLDNDATRRLWQFMEKLAANFAQQQSEANVIIFNTATGEKLKVQVDMIEKQYLEITPEVG